MGQIEYALAFCCLLPDPFAPRRPPLRPWLQTRLGQAGFTLAYSMLSLAVLSWLLSASGWAPYVHLWDWAPWQKMAVLAAMLPVALCPHWRSAGPTRFHSGRAECGLQSRPARNSTADTASSAFCLGTLGRGSHPAKRRFGACDPVRDFHHFRGCGRLAHRPPEASRITKRLEQTRDQEAGGILFPGTWIMGNCCISLCSWRRSVRVNHLAAPIAVRGRSAALTRERDPSPANE